MTLDQFTAAVTAEARALYEAHGEIDSAMLFEVRAIADGAAELFPCWMAHEDATPADIEGDQVALNAAIEPAIRDGIERALIAEYDTLLERHSLPSVDASEAASCLAVAASRGRDHLPEAFSDVGDIEAALDDVEAFIDRWEAAKI